MAKKAGLLFLFAFALFALTAQRGLGWGDSGEFQYRILACGAEGIVRGSGGFATAHPLYVALCQLLCSTPFQVTLVSAFFGAVAVSLLCLITRSPALAALFALSHGLWWLSTVSEVYTLSLCFFAAELLALKRLRETGGLGALLTLSALNGLHLEVHNLALLSLPVYLVVAIRAFRARPRALVAAAGVWCAGAGLWLWCCAALGPADVLWGRYGEQVLTLRPLLPAAIPLNLGLGALSLAVPLLLAVRAAKGRPDFFRRNAVPLALFAIHFLFWSTYFIVSQYTFVLPSVLLAYLLSREAALSRRGFLVLLAVQLTLPLLAWGALAAVGFPSDYRAQHPGRDNAAYFALPWHLSDRSADHAAAFRRTPWKGYP